MLHNSVPKIIFLKIEIWKGETKILTSKDTDSTLERNYLQRM